MPRIRDLKDQQLYRVNKSENIDYGVFTPLLNKTVDLDIVKEQWESMMHVVISLKLITLHCKYRAYHYGINALALASFQLESHHISHL